MSLDQHLPEDFEGREALLSKFKGEDAIAEMAKSYVNLEGYRGRSVAVPDPGDDEAWGKVMERLGRPHSFEDYASPKDIGEGNIDELKRAAFGMDLTQRQFEAFAKTAQQAQGEMDKGREGIVDDIKARYGEKYGEALAAARRAAKEKGVEGDFEADPEMFALLSEIGANMSENAPDGGDSIQPAAPPRKIAQRLRSVMSSAAYNDSFHEDHEEAQEVVGMLRQELREAGYDTAFHPDLLSDYSVHQSFDSEAVRPWGKDDSEIRPRQV